MEPDRLKLSCDELGCVFDDVELASFNDDVVDDLSSAPEYLDIRSRNNVTPK